MHMDALQCSLFGKTAPAAAHFQHAIAGLQLQCVDDALVFAALGFA
jgi:hypothetical protein